MTPTAPDDVGVGVLYLTEVEVRDLVSIEDAIDALERILPEEASEDAVNLAKTLTTWEPRSSAHALGARSALDRMMLFKTWVNTPRGATAMATLFSCEDGAAVAVMEATTLGAIRTAAISGLATRWLADAAADELALVGTGRQALAQIAAISAVRPLRTVRVFSPTAAHRREFAEAARRSFDCAVSECDGVDECLAGAQIVSLLTRARDPFVPLRLLAPGAHVNALGAVLPADAELAPDVLSAAGLVVVDNIANVRLSSREFRETYRTDERKWSGVRTLGEVIADGRGRVGTERVTIFKSVGMGLSDLAVAATAYRAARAQGVGLQLGRPVLHAPRSNRSRSADPEGEYGRV